LAENKPTGYTGKILRINLSDNSISVDEPDDKFYRKYFGGTALIGYYLLKELKPGIDPLGPDNKLVFSSGVITGIPTAGSGRNGVGAKSPLTNGWGDGQAGGYWGAELKRAGWDAIIIEGKAENPVYLWINDDEVEIRDASHLWGKTTADVQAQIRNELGDNKVRVTQTGVAGEKLVRIAGIANDITRYYGRCGLGAVMGSKMLKAIAVRGQKGLPLADSERIQQVARWLVDNRQRFLSWATDYGTSAGVGGLNTMGILPTLNFHEGQFDGFNDITGPTMAETILVDRDTCYACPVNCKRVVKVGAPYNVDPIYGGPEYETIGSLGSLCGVNDLKAIAQGNQTCNAYGLDTIGVGTTIAFAMECYENGIITKEDTGGIELKFGNAQAMMKMVQMIAMREGIGDVLAEGVKRAAEKFGQDAAQYAMHVKGQELPMHDPRGKVGLGIGYATSPTGADHMHNMHDTDFVRVNPTMRALGLQDSISPTELSPAKVRMFRYLTNLQHFRNSALICMFMPYNPHQLTELVNGATGWNTSVWEIMKVGERALALARLFNAREGFTAKDDYLPERLYKGVSKGPLKDKGIDKKAMQQAIQTYYEMSGWDPEGAVPTAAKLHELDLSWAVGELDRRYMKK
jgi:aldehyde:ferredoxin oxidoreductase